MDETTRKRRWHQYWLRVPFLLAIVLVLVSSFFCFFAKMRRSGDAGIPTGTEQVDVADTQSDEGVAVPSQLAADVRRDEQGRVVEIVLSPQSTDEAIAALDGFEGLRRLNATGSQVTDAGLRHLRGMTGLEELWLHSTKVSDQGVGHLETLTGLRKLSLASTGVTDAGLAHLKGLANLTHLYLDDTLVTIEGLERSGLLGRLSVLSIGGTQVSVADRHRFREEHAGLSVFPLDLGSPPALAAGPPAEEAIAEPLVLRRDLQAQDEKAGERGIPPPVEVSAWQLTTPDGMELAATYYPSNKGKDAVPVVMLHMHHGSRRDYAQLAKRLQSLGHAVLVPDLRGHGDSRTRKGAAAALDVSRMNAVEYRNMVLYDMPTLKMFLIKENNAGKLNLEKLVVIGAEMGASVALNWTYCDWIIPPDRNTKQGQDIKALVLISPDRRTPGLPFTKLAGAKPLVTKVFTDEFKRLLKDRDNINFNMPVALDFRREVAALIVVGERDPEALSDAKRLGDMLKAKRPKAQPTQQDLFYDEFDTKLQGTKLLGKNLPLEKHIEVFINLRAAQRSFPWAVRR